MIRGKIKSHVYELASKLPTEPELMKALGVGRSSIREAIRILVNDGYLRVQQGVGTFVISSEGNESLVATFERGQFSELLEVRRLLEIRIAEKVAVNRTEENLKTIRQALDIRKRMATEGDINACINADIAFHQALADACGNSILTELYRASSKYVCNAFGQIYTSTKVFAETQDAHERLYLAVKEKDAVQSRLLLIGIIETV
ncbi:FadR family transcriptional regulator [Sphingobacterium sp. DN00404]|uniref:FadR family transcriptional regulator n=1 Tax=Sphingobacterium micropteri TaxID=2763501 RepID=A0ABR7YL33_9SPHI|nr:FadR family transcriptional regulator [Sphingobacterium micropteri]